MAQCSYQVSQIKSITILNTVCHNGMACLQLVRGDGLQIFTVIAAIILNKQSQTANKV